MSVYTRAGDKGKTHLYQGKIVSKGSLRIDAIGFIDELNSLLGVVVSEIKDKKLKEELTRIQSDLFEIGALLANPTSKAKDLTDRVKDFEKIIDRLEKDLPALSNFILPGGGRVGSFLHLARTVVRRAERRIAELLEKEGTQEEIVVYINRLSDLLFMFARFINYKEKKKEVQWKSR